jgi:hypothetical protein
MSSADVYETFLRMVERYGFGIVLATAMLWFVRTDLVLPMVEAHQQFLKEMASTQKDIGKALREQTQLLYALQPPRPDRSFTSSVIDPEAAPQN